MVIFRGGVFSDIFNISSKNSKTSKVNQQSVFQNLYIFHHFSKNLDRTIIFDSVTLKIHRKNLKTILFFLMKQTIFRVGG